MTTILIDRYRRWFEYEKDVHQKVLASYETVPVEQQTAPAYQKSLDLFAHLASARLLWLHRFGVREPGVKELFPQGITLEELRALVEEMHSAWTAYLAQMEEAELSRCFAYKSLDAGRFRSSIDDILTQLFGHSWYHRGQIAALIKSIGGTPAVTDFVYWSRESMADETN